jgi:hypothetical protein
MIIFAVKTEQQNITMIEKCHLKCSVKGLMATTQRQQ